MSDFNEKMRNSVVLNMKVSKLNQKNQSTNPQKCLFKQMRICEYTCENFLITFAFKMET